MTWIRPEVSVEPSSIALLYDRHAHTILTYVSRFAASSEDADDLVVEVFIAAMEKPVWATWSEGEQLAWLRRIARNKAVDHYRQRIRHPSIPLEQAVSLLYEDEQCAPEARALRHEDETRWRAHVSQLSELQQEIVHLRFGHGLRSKEIAQRLQKSDTAVRVLLSRALNRLRALYLQQEGV